MNQFVRMGIKQDLRPSWYFPLHYPASPWKIVQINIYSELIEYYTIIINIYDCDLNFLKGQLSFENVRDIFLTFFLQLFDYTICFREAERTNQSSRSLHILYIKEFIVKFLMAQALNKLRKFEKWCSTILYLSHDRYYSLTIIEIACALGLTCWVLRFHHYNTSVGKVPKWVRVWATLS